MPSPANDVWCNVKIPAMVLQQRFPRKGFIAQTALVRSFRIRITTFVQRCVSYRFASFHSLLVHQAL
jgi:hypothetical protein